MNVYAHCYFFKILFDEQNKPFVSCPTLLNWDLSVDKNGLSVSPTDEALSKYIHTVDRQRLAWQHVSRLQMTFTGVSTQPGADEGLIPSSWGHRTARHHTCVPATWETK